MFFFIDFRGRRKLNSMSFYVGSRGREANFVEGCRIIILGVKRIYFVDLYLLYLQFFFIGSLRFVNFRGEVRMMFIIFREVGDLEIFWVFGQMFIDRFFFSRKFVFFFIDEGEVIVGIGGFGLGYNLVWILVSFLYVWVE